MIPSRHLAAVPEGAAPVVNDAVTVVIAEDHPLMRGSLRALLEASPGTAVAAEAGNLALARQHVIGHRPDVLVLDLQMPDGSSIQAIGDLRRRSPDTHVVVVSMEDTPGFAQRVLAAGASGYVLKELAAEDLPAAVHAAAAGGEYISEPVAERLSRARQALTHGRLTGREAEVL